MCKGQHDDIQESAILEGYRCKDYRCNGFLLRDSEDKGFICQTCGLRRSKEEVKRIVCEVTAISDKKLKSTSPGRVYPELHPLLGLQYYTCGKIEWLLGYTEDAIKSLTRAVDILRITHGTNSPFMKELMTKLDEARAEASYNLSSKDE